MKAEMSAKGILSIVPETPLEAYALGAWSKENLKPAGNALGSYEVSNLILEYRGDELFPAVLK
jgi:hypothetical protein